MARNQDTILSKQHGTRLINKTHNTDNCIAPWPKSTKGKTDLLLTINFKTGSNHCGLFYCELLDVSNKNITVGKMPDLSNIYTIMVPLFRIDKIP